MSKRRGLGRGLDALIPSGESQNQEGAPGAVELKIESLSPNPRQPRRRFDADELSELADSIREHGVLQPLIVVPGPEDHTYVLIAGERRLQAARLAGLATVPAVVREASEEQTLVWAMIENLQREDLNPVEAAQGYRQLNEEFDLSHEQIAEQVGKSRSAVTNTLRLLALPEPIQDALVDARISEGHARALLGLTTEAAQLSALEAILARDMNVRQTEELVREKSGRKSRPRRARQPEPELEALENELRSTLGTRVSIKRGRTGGTITLHFYSDEELNALIDHLRK